MLNVGVASSLNDQAHAWKAAQDFESVALGQFLTPMFATVDLSGTPFGGGEAEQTWQSMLVSEMGKQMQKAGGIGIAKSVYAEMLRMQEQGNGHGASPLAGLTTPVTPPGLPVAGQAAAP